MKGFIIFAVLVAVSYAQEVSLCPPGVNRTARIEAITELQRAILLEEQSGNNQQAIKDMKDSLKMEIKALFYLSESISGKHFLLDKEPQIDHDLAVLDCVRFDFEVASVIGTAEQSFVKDFLTTIPDECQIFEHIRIAGPFETCTSEPLVGISTYPDVRLCLSLKKPEYEYNSIHCYQPLVNTVHTLCEVPKSLFE